MKMDDPKKRLPTFGPFNVALTQMGETVRGVDDWWVIGVYENSLRDRSNVATIVQALQTLGGDCVRWGTDPRSGKLWALVNPAEQEAVEVVRVFLSHLDRGASVLSDSHYEQLVAATAEKFWREMTMPDRLSVLRDCEQPVGLARKAELAELPQGVRFHMETDVSERYC